MRALRQRSSRAAAVLRRRRPRDGGRRASSACCRSTISPSSAFPPFRAGCRGSCSHMVADGSRGAGAAAACAGHHRQPGLHAAGCALRALVRPLDPDRRLRLAVGLGLAAGAGALRCALCRSCAGAAAVRARGASPARRAALQLCRPSADRDVCEAAPERGRGAAPDGRPAGRAGLPGSRSSEVARLAGDLRRDAGARCRARRADRGGGADRAASRSRRSTQATCGAGRSSPASSSSRRRSRGLPRGAGGAGQIRHRDARARASPACRWSPPTGSRRSKPR